MGVLVTKRSISLVLDGKPYQVLAGNSTFRDLQKLLTSHNYTVEEVESLLTVGNMLKAKFNNIGSSLVMNDDEEIFCNGKRINLTLEKKLIEDIENGISVTNFYNFVVNLMQNESQDSIDELYLFMQFANMPLTEDGHFLAYKKIRDDYTDCWTGTIDNSIGEVVSMDRRRVDSNRKITCSDGLHFCSYKYLPEFRGGSGYRVVILKINPKDVVSIPNDYNNTKGRCCKYQVVAEYKNWKDGDIFLKADADKLIKELSN